MTNKGYDIKSSLLWAVIRNSNAFDEPTVGFDLWFGENCGKLEGPCLSRGDKWRICAQYEGAIKGFMVDIKESPPPTTGGPELYLQGAVAT